MVVNSSRDDFTEKTKRILAGRVAYLCSNPDCKRQTIGPHSDIKRTFNIGKAAHMAAAAAGGPRADSSLTSEERKSPDNGIWLCTSCAELIDKDEDRYPLALLREWKAKAETIAWEALLPTYAPGGSTDLFSISKPTRFGIDTSARLVDGTTIPYAVTVDTKEDDVTCFAGPAFVIRFLLEKNHSLPYILISQLRATVHAFEQEPEHELLMYAYPQQSNLYFIELPAPRSGQTMTASADQYFVTTNEMPIESRFSGLRIEDNVAELFDVRFNAKASGLYTISLDVHAAHGTKEQTKTVLEPTRVLFRNIDDIS